MKKAFVTALALALASVPALPQSETIADRLTALYAVGCVTDGECVASTVRLGLVVDLVEAPTHVLRDWCLDEGDRLACEYVAARFELGRE
ncbi:hypothetical protein [Amorphus sp. MBR-141]